ncbi:MAG TPA: NIPSNAP family protein [Candidatus Cybelea sp.]
MTANQSYSRIIEVRQYLLREHRRDDLISLFEREFIESQEAAGMTIVGTFRVAGDPQRFFWIRGFPDMETRARALREFYEGPVWRANSSSANDTMIDSDNVLLLHSASARSGFRFDNLDRPAPGATGGAGRAFVATIFDFGQPVESDFFPFFEARFGPTMKNLGMELTACLVTERSPNNFPRLPIREDANAFVALGTFSDETSFKRYCESLRLWEKTGDSFAQKLRGTVEILRLIPTARSLLR